MKPEDFARARADAVQRLHAAAHAALDERPDARVRATVLAVAARAVDAGPRRPAGLPFGPRRAWSIAAVLVVSIATGLITTHALQSDPARVLASSGSEPTIAASTPEAAIASTEPPSPPPHVEMADGREQAGPRAELPNTSTSSASSARAKTQQRATRTAPAPSRDRSPTPTKEETPVIAEHRPRAEAMPFPASTTASPPVPPMPSLALVAPPAAPSVPSTDATTIRNARSSFVAPVARSEVDATQRAPHGRVGIEPANPEAWVARIVTMRAHGDDDAADREVDALHARYPTFEIPRDALRGGRLP